MLILALYYHDSVRVSTGAFLVYVLSVLPVGVYEMATCHLVKYH